MQGAEDSQETHRSEIDHGVYDPVAAEAMRLEDEDLYDPAMVEKRHAQRAFALLEENTARQAFDDARARAIRDYEKHCKKEKCENGVPNERDKYGMPTESNVNLLEAIGGQRTELNVADIPKFLCLQVIVDSGAGAHVISKKMIPGYLVEESEMSRAGTNFRGADGGKIKNHGQVFLNLMAPDSDGNGRDISSKFEVADVTRALWSVGLITDSGLKVSFSKTTAHVHDQHGKELCVFHRTNGLYVADVKIKNPMHKEFQRREP